MGLVGKVALVLALLFGLAVFAAALFYVSDGAVQAKTVAKRCAGPITSQASGSSVLVRTTTPIPGIEYTAKGIPDSACNLAQPGNHVVFRIRSAHLTVFQTEGGKCLYDSVTGVGCSGGR